MQITSVEVGNLKSSDSPFLFLGLGSCFINHFEKFAQSENLPYAANPLGTSFNPISIGRQVEWIFKSNFNLLPLFKHNGSWHQLDAAARFNATSQADLNTSLNEQRERIQHHIRSGENHQPILLVSFGTAHAWYLSDTLVNNCHKLPNDLFSRSILDVDTIVSYWKNVLKTVPKHWKIVFTVSAVKYSKLGMVQNSLGKSILRLAIEKLIQEHSQCYYFPSFEIITDELRDYSYFKENGTHPTDEAAGIVMERFKGFLSL
ncbi:MAG: GSCFA domain-containing protein [Bacteroidia bacterium]